MKNVILTDVSGATTRPGPDWRSWKYDRCLVCGKKPDHTPNIWGASLFCDLHLPIFSLWGARNDTKEMHTLDDVLRAFLRSEFPGLTLEGALGLQNPCAEVPLRFTDAQEPPKPVRTKEFWDRYAGFTK